MIIFFLWVRDDTQREDYKMYDTQKNRWKSELEELAEKTGFAPEEIVIYRDYLMPSHQSLWKEAICRCNGNGDKLENILPVFAMIYEKNIKEGYQQ